MANTPSYTKRGNSELETSLVVIEYHHENGVEWGLSFDGPNPLNKDDYFIMIDKESAFRLKDKLSAKFPPVKRKM